MYDGRRKGVVQKVDTKKFGVHSGRQVHNPFAAPVMQFWALGSMGGTAARACSCGLVLLGRFFAQKHPLGVFRVFFVYLSCSLLCSVLESLVSA